MNSDKFCPMPFGSMHVDPDGKIYICCSDRGPIVDDYNNVMNVQTHSLREAWNSKHYQKIRLEFLSGQKPASCVECWNSEVGDSSTSTRTSAIERYEKFENIGYRLNDAINEAKENNGILINSSAIDYQVMSGNLCNLACKMCFPSYSNGWTKFYTSRNIDVNDITYHSSVKMPSKLYEDFNKEYNWPKKTTIQNILQDDLDNIYFLNLTGGEPTILPENINLINNLKKSKNINKLELCIITNTTNINKKLLDALDGFYKITIVSSLDAMDEIANIQRSPSNWSQIYNNLLTLRQFSYYKSNVSHGVNTVITALNLHHIGSFWDFLVSTKDLKMNPSMISVAVVVNKDYPVGLEIVPRSAIAKIKEEFQKKLSLHNSEIYKNVMDYFDNIDWAHDNTLMLEMLDNIQKYHPEHNIKELYKIYYE